MLLTSWKHLLVISMRESESSCYVLDQRPSVQTCFSWHQGDMFGFIRSFLDERNFQVRLHQLLSGLFRVMNGTPQGSIFSPTRLIKCE